MCDTLFVIRRGFLGGSGRSPALQMVEEKARVVLSKSEFATLAYYQEEYAAGQMTIEAFVAVLLELLSTPEKVCNASPYVEDDSYPTCPENLPVLPSGERSIHRRAGGGAGYRSSLRCLGLRKHLFCGPDSFEVVFALYFSLLEFQAL